MTTRSPSPTSSSSPLCSCLVAFLSPLRTLSLPSKALSPCTVTAAVNNSSDDSGAAFLSIHLSPRSSLSLFLSCHFLSPPLAPLSATAAVSSSPSSASAALPFSPLPPLFLSRSFSLFSFFLFFPLIGGVGNLGI
ncbi:hypothetical protein HN51_049076 [Arachis hypogaea]